MSRRTQNAEQQGNSQGENGAAISAEKKPKKADRFPHITFKNRLTRACCRAIADGIISETTMAMVLKNLSEDFSIPVAAPTEVVA